MGSAEPGAQHSRPGPGQGLLNAGACGSQDAHGGGCHQGSGHADGQQREVVPSEADMLLKGGGGTDTVKQAVAQRGLLGLGWSMLCLVVMAIAGMCLLQVFHLCARVARHIPMVWLSSCNPMRDVHCFSRPECQPAQQSNPSAAGCSSSSHLLGPCSEAQHQLKCFDESDHKSPSNKQNL